ncbi:MAG: beta-N-acetylhexosaminidase [Clostridia bacterium]
MLKIIPKPNEIIESEGVFVFDEFCSFSYDEFSKDFCKKFEKQINSKKNKLSISTNNIKKISFFTDYQIENECYKINCSAEILNVFAGSKSGYFYAMQTLTQMLFKNNDEQLCCPCVVISDKPAYSWRGFMLDEARHFFGEAEVKRLLDLMALNKLNVFHWHLSDDQGFRVESKKYPLLTAIGAKRSDTQVNGWRSNDYRCLEHKGFYTQAQIKDIVAYAKERNIMVVPEIDMPGHFISILASYPNLSCTGVQMPVKVKFGISKTIACAGNPNTYNFIYNLLDELCELFPAPYFHIGGDEAPKNEWETCPLCQKTIKDNNLKDEHQLQGFFTNKIATYLSAKGKKTICWNDSLAENLHKDVIIQYWTVAKDKRVVEHLKAGRQFIISKSQYVYFDMPYAKIPLQKTYGFSPELSEFAGLEQYKNQILGGEGCLWTEWVYDRTKIDFNCFPRMCALSEACWTNKQSKNFSSFLQRTENIKQFLKPYKINFASNKINNPKCHFNRAMACQKWFLKDQYFEVRNNKEEK